MTQPEPKPCPHTGAAGYTPPFPDPRSRRPNLFGRFRAFTRSWLNVFFANSYRMKSGTFRIPGKRYFIVNDAPDVRQVLSAGAQAYPKGPVLQRMLRLLLGDGIFISNGKTWKRQREMMEQALTLSHIKRVFPFMQSAVDLLLERLSVKTRQTDCNISEEMAFVTADIIFRTIFTKPLTAEESALIFRSFARYQKRVARLSPLFFIGARPEWFRGLLGESANAIRGVIRENTRLRLDAYQDSGVDEYDDILNGMMLARDDAGEAFDLEELTDQIAVLFLAGHETSATTLSWAFYILAQCPHLQTAIRDEVQAVTAGQAIEYAHIRKLKTAQEVFRETLRLYPPVGGFVREATCPLSVRDKQIAPGDAVVVLPWLLHRREDQWPDTHEFHPQRFSDAGQQDTIRNYYYPFSAGERVCIGAGFASQEAILILARVVSAFHLSPVAGCEPQPVGHITIKPDQNIRLTLQSPAE